nr:hypothetical protein [Planococcus glaciei]
MKSVLFYFIPLAMFAAVNNLVDRLYWPYYLVLLLAFLVFQLARVRYPKRRCTANCKKSAKPSFTY